MLHCNNFLKHTGINLVNELLSFSLVSRQGTAVIALVTGKGGIIFYREGAVCLWDQEKLATGYHRQTAPLLVKNDSSLKEN